MRRVTRHAAPNPGPDVLCVGMQKAGTTWLYDQLRAHPDVWMPPVKELHFFDGRFRSRPGRAVQAAKTGPQQDRDKRFLRRAATYSQEAGIDWYGNLFRPKGSLISGDVTPAYSTLPAEAIAEIMASFPAAKVILILRDPVDRFWSYFCMMQRKGRRANVDPSDWRSIEANLTEVDVRSRSYPTEIYAKWRQAVPAGQFFLGFFDRLTEDPDAFRADIFSFLGLSVTGLAFPAGYNRQTGYKAEMPVEIRARLKEHFREELRRSAEIFGEAARDWSAQ